MKIASLAVFQCYSTEPVENGYFDKFPLIFHLPPRQRVHSFTISVKDQARLTWKIVGPYSRVFTLLHLHS